MQENINEHVKILNKIKISKLSNKALLITSKLSREIKKANGKVIKLSDHSMAVHLAEQVIEIDNPVLSELYRTLYHEVIKGHSDK